jgi:23S rRNA pseudouridine1911/1915/1917 synthase
MKHIGHTLFNDERYGGNAVLKGTTFTKYKQFVENCFDIAPRAVLHAKSLAFTQPITKQRLSFETDLPPDMQLLLEKWRGYVASRKE